MTNYAELNSENKRNNYQERFVTDILNKIKFKCWGTFPVTLFTPSDREFLTYDPTTTQIFIDVRHNAGRVAHEYFIYVACIVFLRVI